MNRRTFLHGSLIVCLTLVVCVQSGRAQLFENLEAFGSRLGVGDPDVASGWGGHEGPKGIAVGDLDGDGSPDFAVSNLDGTVTVFFNRGDGDFFEPSHLRGEIETLRGIVVADFNGDGQTDLAVINRISNDVSILTTYPGEVAFGALDQYYLVDGEVSGLWAVDVNGAGRDDVIQLQRRSGDASIRPSREGGSLAAGSLRDLRMRGSVREEPLAMTNATRAQGHRCEV